MDESRCCVLLGDQGRVVVPQEEGGREGEAGAARGRRERAGPRVKREGEAAVLTRLLAPGPSGASSPRQSLTALYVDGTSTSLTATGTAAPYLFIFCQIPPARVRQRCFFSCLQRRFLFCVRD